MPRIAEIIARLDEVLDPEIDRSVVAMGFVHDIQEHDGAVRISFRLPTHWCGANFAFMMADDMRGAVAALPWATQVEVRLTDHFAAGRINHAVASGHGFAGVFPGEASGDLAAVRRRFLEKAFLGRQEALLQSLARDRGISATLDLRMRELIGLAGDPGPHASEARRYLSVRRQLGGSAAGNAPAFTDLDGRALTVAGYPLHVREARRARSAAEANAEHCQLLMLARQAAPAPEDGTAPAGMYE